MTTKASEVIRRSGFCHAIIYMKFLFSSLTFTLIYRRLKPFMSEHSIRKVPTKPSTLVQLYERQISRIKENAKLQMFNSKPVMFTVSRIDPLPSSLSATSSFQPFSFNLAFLLQISLISLPASFLSMYRIPSRLFFINITHVLYTISQQAQNDSLLESSGILLPLLRIIQPR